jgi:hypothetical protein
MKDRTKRQDPIKVFIAEMRCDPVLSAHAELIRAVFEVLDELAAVSACTALMFERVLDVIKQPRDLDHRLGMVADLFSVAVREFPELQT